jgi:hypothetical protein
MNKNIYSLLFILCLACPAGVGAQETPADATWLLTLETIKAGSSQLMAQNTRLTADYKMLVQDIDQLNASLEEQSRKNAALADFLKTRHGRSDQQVRIQELERQIKDQRDELKTSRQGEKGGELDRLRQELKIEKANEAKLEEDLRRQTRTQD